MTTPQSFESDVDMQDTIQRGTAATISANLFGASLPDRFPSTRFQGSKRKILPELGRAFTSLKFDTCLDLYTGTGLVSLLLRILGKATDANDYLAYNRVSARLFLTAKRRDFADLDYRSDLRWLLESRVPNDKNLVAENYRGIFFTDEENEEIDRFCQNVASFEGVQRDLYIYAMGQALLMKRPYNLFHRANLDMRTRTVERSFGNKKTWETPIFDHCVKIIRELIAFPFPAERGTGRVHAVNTLDLAELPTNYDLVYVDPPYLNSAGIAVNYADFYHFLDGLVDYEKFAAGDRRYPHRPLLKPPSAWASASGARDELSRIATHWADSIIFVSYRSDGSPTPDEMVEALSGGGRRVELHSCGEYKYALSRTNSNEELFLISFPQSAKEMAA